MKKGPAPTPSPCVITSDSGRLGRLGTESKVISWGEKGKL
jgi:hypothetical protein